MGKNIIKAYAMKLEVNDVINFGQKEGVNVTENEANVFLITVKENIDYILDGHALELLESKRDEFTNEVYEKLVELFDKYKKFIG